jgi:mercuric ion transport protein
MSSGTPSGSLSFAAGAVVSAFLASACCLGPLFFALVGLGGAGMFHSLSPYRPYFLLATLGLLGVGFYRTYRTPKDDCGCEPKTRSPGRQFLLWVSGVVVLGFLLFPYFEPYFIA